MGDSEEDEVTWGTAGGGSHVVDGRPRPSRLDGTWRCGTFGNPVDPQKPGGPLEMWRTLGDPEDPRDLVDPRRPSGQAMTWWTLGNSVKTLQHLVGPAKTRGQMKSQRTLRYPVDR